MKKKTATTLKLFKQLNNHLKFKFALNMKIKVEILKNFFGHLKKIPILRLMLSI